MNVVTCKKRDMSKKVQKSENSILDNVNDLLENIGSEVNLEKFGKKKNFVANFEKLNGKKTIVKNVLGQAKLHPRNFNKKLRVGDQISKIIKCENQLFEQRFNNNMENYGIKEGGIFEDMDVALSKKKKLIGTRNLEDQNLRKFEYNFQTAKAITGSKEHDIINGRNPLGPRLRRASRASLQRNITDPKKQAGKFMRIFGKTRTQDKAHKISYALACNN